MLEKTISSKPKYPTWANRKDFLSFRRHRLKVISLVVTFAPQLEMSQQIPRLLGGLQIDRSSDSWPKAKSVRDANRPISSVSITVTSQNRKTQTKLIGRPEHASSNEHRKLRLQRARETTSKPGWLHKSHERLDSSVGIIANAASRTQ